MQWSRHQNSLERKLICLQDVYWQLIDVHYQAWTNLERALVAREIEYPDACNIYSLLTCPDIAATSFPLWKNDFLWMIVGFQTKSVSTNTTYLNDGLRKLWFQVQWSRLFWPYLWSLFARSDTEINSWTCLLSMNAPARSEDDVYFILIKYLSWPNQDALHSHDPELTYFALRRNWLNFESFWWWPNSSKVATQTVADHRLGIWECHFSWCIWMKRFGLKSLYRYFHHSL